jgi:hypothetical protein
VTSLSGAIYEADKAAVKKILVRQHTTAEEFPELGGDERWQATPISTGIDGGEEIGEVRAHHTVEHARRRRPRHVDAGHAVRT